MPRRKPGRPSKLDAKTKQDLLAALGSGASLAAAADYVGIGERTVKEWLAKGKKRPGSEYGNFRTEVMRCRKSAEVLAAGIVFKAIRGDPAKGVEGNWKAAMRYLQSHSREWQRREKHEVSGPKGGPIPIAAAAHVDLLGKLSEDELAALEAIKRKLQPAPEASSPAPTKPEAAPEAPPTEGPPKDG